ncbi:MAG: glycine cleavage system protein H [Candidatus Thorarchaeota archaeon]
MGRKYILPCAGYDRPGGELSRVLAECIVKTSNDVVIGSMGALFSERPGEMRDYRTSEIICLNGCSTNCASELARQRGKNDLTIISIPEISDPLDGFEEKVKRLVETVEEIMERMSSKATTEITVDSLSAFEYFEEKFDKFVLRVAKNHKYSDNDFWVRVEGESVRIGASDFLQQMMSDVYFVDLAEPGTHVDMFDDAGAMESTKILVEIIVPVSGTIVESNESLVDSPELINESPYDRGWLYLLKPDDLDELELLRDSQDYMTYALDKARAEIGKKVV